MFFFVNILIVISPASGHQENCQQDVKIEVVVSSNEVSYAKSESNSMVMIKERYDARQSHQLEVGLRALLSIIGGVLSNILRPYL